MAYNKYKIFEAKDINIVNADDFIFDQGSIRWSIDRSKFILEYNVDAVDDFMSHEEACEITLTSEWYIEPVIEDEQPEQQD